MPPRGEGRGEGRGSPPAPAEQAALLAEVQRAFQAWLGTPAGQAALREVQGAGLAPEAALERLAAQFMAELGAG